jgi:hypothetical protein
VWASVWTAADRLDAAAICVNGLHDVAAVMMV